jgi:glutamate racemase
MQDMKAPIGIFDSGVGGLTVLSRICDLMPKESIIYVADSYNAPYGELPKNEIIKRSEIITDFLLSKGAKLIVVACNTATAAAIDFLREKYDVPFVGMEPAVKPASLLTKSGNIGVLATKGTLMGKLFKEKHETYGVYFNIHYTEGKGLVELAEQNMTESLEAEELLNSYLQPMIRKEVDQLVLGCTHYPLFINLINKITNGKVNIINPAEAIARRTKDLLILNRKLYLGEKKGVLTFYSNGELKIFENILKQIELEGEYSRISKFTY